MQAAQKWSRHAATWESERPPKCSIVGPGLYVPCASGFHGIGYKACCFHPVPRAFYFESVPKVTTEPAGKKDLGQCRKFGSLVCHKQNLRRLMLSPFHGCCWEAFYIFAYCGLVGNPRVTAIYLFITPLLLSTKLLRSPLCADPLTGFGVRFDRNGRLLLLKAAGPGLPMARHMCSTPAMVTASNPVEDFEIWKAVVFVFFHPSQLEPSRSL